MRRWVAFLAILWVAGPAWGRTHTGRTTADDVHAPNQVVALLKPGLDAAALDAGAAALGLTRVAGEGAVSLLERGLSATAQSPLPSIRGVLLMLQGGGDDRSVEAARRAEASGLAAASVNRIQTVFGASDPFVADGHQWAWPAVRADQAWQAWRGGALRFSTKTILLAVLDTGINLAHEDLASVAEYGANFVDPGADPADDHGHGTFVASIAVAKVDNGLGIAGTGFTQVRVRAYKVMNSSGKGTDYQIAQGILAAAADGAQVINLSLGGYGGPPIAEQAAVLSAMGAGCVVVAAAGNEGYGPEAISYPAGFDGVLSVGATGSDGMPTAYSDYGKVTLAAPGGDSADSPASCTDASNWATEVLGACYTSPSGYHGWAGTSFSCPMVAGAAAMVLAQNPNLQPSAVADHLVSHGDPVPAKYGKSGWRMLNLYATLAAPKISAGGAADRILAFPNPFNPGGRGRLALKFSPLGRAVRVRIYDRSWRLVRELDGSDVDSGAGLAWWDGRDSRGGLLPSGVYHTQLWGGGSAQGKLTLLW